MVRSPRAARFHFVGDTIRLTADQPIRDGSAVLFTGTGKRLALPTPWRLTGLIGSEALDGRIPGDFDADVLVELKIRIAHEGAH